MGLTVLDGYPAPQRLDLPLVWISAGSDLDVPHSPNEVMDPNDSHSTLAGRLGADYVRTGNAPDQ